jgi:hypothetical protein
MSDTPVFDYKDYTDEHNSPKEPILIYIKSAAEKIIVLQ